MGVAENKKIVLAFIEAISNGNEEETFANFADDVTWWLPGSLPVSGTHKGKQGIIDGLLGPSRPFLVPNSISIEVRGVIGENDYVAVEWIARAQTVKGPKYENYYFLMFEIKNKKIQHVREYVDTLYAKDVIFS